jgi:hypothetical protein
MSELKSSLKYENLNGNEHKPKVAIRGKAAALLASLSTSDSDSDSDLFASKNAKTSTKSSGIYSNILQITKKQIENTKNKFEIVDSRSLKNIINK